MRRVDRGHPLETWNVDVDHPVETDTLSDHSLETDKFQPLRGSDMRVAVGSTNPVKREATAAAFEALPGGTVEMEAVDSGVSEQPTGHEETVRGAENRAEAALAAGPYGLGVGIEGGVAEFGPDRAGRRTWGGGRTDGEEALQLYLVMWAAVTDGETWGRAAGPAIPLPGHVADRIRDGEELGPVMDDAFGLENVKENQGAAGVLTGNLTDRETALRTAVAGALGPFVTDCY